MKKTDIVGVVLAGGNSSRMGSNKAFLRRGEATFVEHAVGVLGKVFEHVIISANDPSLYDSLELHVIGDIHKGCGPMGGLHATMVHARGKDIFVLSCDLPFVDISVVERLLAESADSDVVIAGDNSGPQPLCGLYRKSCRTTIEGMIKEKQYSVLALVSRMKGKVVLFDDGRAFTNVNTPTDYDSMAEVLKSS